MIKSVSEYFFFVNFIKIYEKINNSSKNISYWTILFKIIWYYIKLLFAALSKYVMEKLCAI